MHIAMLSIHSSPLAQLGGKEAGGMNVYVRELSRHLALHGVTVDIFTRRSAAHLPTVQALMPGVRLVHVPAGPAAPYDKNRILDHLPAMLAFIEQFAATNPAPYDLIHSHYWISGEVALALRERWRVPVVQMFHTLGAMKNQVARSTEETETLARIAIERRLLQQVDTVIAATPLDLQQMQKHYTADLAPTTIIPPGVDTEHFTPHPQAKARACMGLALDQRYVLCIGRIEPLKGMDALIEALALLHQSNPLWRETLQVLLVGGATEDDPAAWNTEQHRLHTLRTTLGVARAVQFVGAVPHAALPDYYAAADVLAIPSHYESFGMVALEGMASGVPVVASAVGGLTYSITDGQSGLLVPPADPPALAAQIERLLTDPMLRDGLRAGGVQQAGAYGWPRITGHIIELYKKLIGPER
ncbi:MAG: glycosyltransferase family 1 protein [Chloroflexaceae bacterium]|nr:glycosyltransferase family 1 protein [Chloroflexaceae bacterium]